jgi:Holliday junction resolvase RusA-like endonuclease
MAHLPPSHTVCVRCGQPELAGRAGKDRLCRRCRPATTAAAVAERAEPAEVQFIVWGPPLQWKRATGTVRRRTHQDVADWAVQIAAAARRTVGEGIAYPDGPVAVTAVFVLRQRPGWDWPLHPHDFDVDNAAKLLLDAVQGDTGPVYLNDRQVVRLDARKEYGPEPMTAATVRRPP